MKKSNIEDRIVRPILYNGPGNLLAKLFRKTLMELGYTPNRFSKELDKYVARINTKDSMYVKTVARSHVIRKLTNEDLTWKVFLDGILQFAGAIKVDVSIKLYWRNGKSTTHGITILNNEVDFDDKK